MHLPELQSNPHTGGWQVTLVPTIIDVIDMVQLQVRLVEELSRHKAPGLHLVAQGLLFWRVCLFSCTTIISEARFSPETRVVRLSSQK